MPDFFDATHSEFDGEVDWAADEATGIDTRTKMAYGKVYRRLDTSYCSSCGIGTVQRSDVATNTKLGLRPKLPAGPARSHFS